MLKLKPSGLCALLPFLIASYGFNSFAAKPCNKLKAIRSTVADLPIKIETPAGEQIIEVYVDHFSQNSGIILQSGNSNNYVVRYFINGELKKETNLPYRSVAIDGTPFFLKPDGNLIDIRNGWEFSLKQDFKESVGGTNLLRVTGVHFKAENRELYLTLASDYKSALTKIEFGEPSLTRTGATVYFPIVGDFESGPLLAADGADYLFIHRRKNRYALYHTKTNEEIDELELPGRRNEEIVNYENHATFFLTQSSSHGSNPASSFIDLKNGVILDLSNKSPKNLPDSLRLIGPSQKGKALLQTEEKKLVLVDFERSSVQPVLGFKSASDSYQYYLRANDSKYYVGFDRDILRPGDRESFNLINTETLASDQFFVSPYRVHSVENLTDYKLLFTLDGPNGQRVLLKFDLKTLESQLVENIFDQASRVKGQHFLENGSSVAVQYFEDPNRITVSKLNWQNVKSDSIFDFKMQEKARAQKLDIQLLPKVEEIVSDNNLSQAALNQLTAYFAYRQYLKDPLFLEQALLVLAAKFPEKFETLIETQPEILKTLTSVSVLENKHKKNPYLMKLIEKYLGEFNVPEKLDQYPRRFEYLLPFRGQFKYLSEPEKQSALEQLTTALVLNDTKFLKQKIEGVEGAEYTQLNGQLKKVANGLIKSTFFGSPKEDVQAFAPLVYGKKIRIVRTRLNPDYDWDSRNPFFETDFKESNVPTSLVDGESVKVVEQGVFKGKTYNFNLEIKAKSDLKKAFFETAPRYKEMYADLKMTGFVVDDPGMQLQSEYREYFKKLGYQFDPNRIAVSSIKEWFGNKVKARELDYCIKDSHLIGGPRELIVGHSAGSIEIGVRKPKGTTGGARGESQVVYLWHPNLRSGTEKITSADIKEWLSEGNKAEESQFIFFNSKCNSFDTSCSETVETANAQFQSIGTNGSVSEFSADAQGAISVVLDGLHQRANYREMAKKLAPLNDGEIVFPDDPRLITHYKAVFKQSYEVVRFEVTE